MKSPKLEKGIELPPKGGGFWVDTFRTMEIGDSFLVPVHVSVGSSRNAAIAVGIKIAQRLVSRSPRRYRVWRVG